MSAGMSSESAYYEVIENQQQTEQARVAARLDAQSLQTHGRLLGARLGKPGGSMDLTM
jgi:hypothetical protein